MVTRLLISDFRLLRHDILMFATPAPQRIVTMRLAVSLSPLILDRSISAMFSSELPQENGQSNNNVVTLMDESGRRLSCSIEHSLEAEGTEYLLLMPVDTPVEIVAWDGDDEEDEDSADATLLEDDTEIDLVFADAQAVLAEQNLTLKRTAFTLTVAGKVPSVEDVDEADILTIEIEEDDVKLEPEELMFLASFYHEEQKYEIYTPLDPLLFPARRNKMGEAELLSPEELQKVQPLLNEWLFDELDQE